MRELDEYNGGMPGAPDRSLRVARRAATRIGMSHLVRTVGLFLVAGAAAGIVAAGVGSFVWGPRVGIIAAGACVVLAGAAAVVVETLRMRSPLAAAVRVDAALGLKDRISSAVEFGGGTTDPFVRLAVDDAERVAEGVDVRRAVPIRADRAWGVWPVLAAAAVGAALLMPMVPRGGTEAPDPERIAQARDLIASATTELVQGIGAQPEAAGQDAIDRMREIERELAQGLQTPEEAATEASAVVEEAADRLETAAHAQREQVLRERLAEIEPEEVGDASALAQALRDGDLAGAAESLREMARRSGEMSAAERRQLADDLRRLSEQLRPEADTGSEPVAPSEPGDPGEPESAEPTVQGGSPEEQNKPEERAEPAEAPQGGTPTPGNPSGSDEGSTAPEQPTDGPQQVNDEDARGTRGDRAAREQIAKDARKDSQREAGNADADELADRLDEVADTIENPDRPRQTGEQNQQEPRGDTQRPEPGERGEPQPGAADQPQPPSAGSPDGAGRGDQPAGEREAEPSPDQPGKTGESRGSKPGDEPAEGEPEKVESVPEGASPRPGTGPSGESKPGTPESGKPAGDQGAGSKDETAAPGAGSGQTGKDDAQNPVEGTPEPGGTSVPSPDEQRSDTPNAGESAAGRAGDDPKNADAPARPMDTVPGGGGGEQRGDGLDRALNQLERLDRRQRESLQRLSQSEKLRDRARDLLEGASPEQRRRIADLADRLREDMAASTPADWDPETELFDARGQAGPDGTERQVGTAEPTGPPEWSGQGSTADRPERVRRAAAAAEQAIEGQAIPRKYRDFVRRVYQRLEEQAAPVPEGKDAVTPADDAGGAGG